MLSDTSAVCPQADLSTSMSSFVMATLTPAAYWACGDQIVSGEGKASRYYPRIITSALWME
jgi:hypothetical protein